MRSPRTTDSAGGMRAALTGAIALVAAALDACQSRPPAARRWDTSQSEFHFAGPAVLALANPGRGGIHSSYLKWFLDEFDLAADSLERAGYAVGVSFRDKVLVIEGADTVGLEGPREQDPAGYYFFAPGRHPHAVPHELRAHELLGVLHGWERAPEAVALTGREALSVQVNDQHALLTDARGRRAGYRSAGRPPLREIPHSNYEERPLPNGWVAIVTDSAAVPGTYQIAIVAARADTFELTTVAINPGAVRTPVSARGVTNAGTTSRFRLEYSAAVGVAFVVTPIVDFAATLRHIAASRKLGLIDRPAVAAALSQQIRAAQSARTLGDDRASAASLDAFRSLLHAQGSHVRPYAAQILAEDAALLAHP